jgi:hypothetical protein
MLGIEPKTWTRLDVVHYSPTAGGRIQFGHNLVDYIDDWRTPGTPEQVQTFYDSFARQESGSVGKWSYVRGYYSPPDDDSITALDTEWRAPDLLPAWHRFSLDITDPSQQQIVEYRVPHSTEIEIRTRAVNDFGDPGQWHVPSGLISAAGNVRPGPVDNKPPIDFSLDVGVGNFEFKVVPNVWEQWDEYILVSGGDHNPSLGTFALNVGASPGDTSIQLTGTPSFSVSGMLVTIEGSDLAPPQGGYSGDSGELHLASWNDGGTLYLQEPITQGINTSPTKEVRFYQIAKKTNETHFNLPVHDKEDWYFNMVGRTRNGGITAFAKPIDAWETNALTITAGDVGVVDLTSEGANSIRNGSFEIPAYDTGFGGDMRYNPADYWFVVSGEHDLSGLGAGKSPALWTLADGAEQGVQSVYFRGNQFGSGDALPLYGVHNGVEQHLFSVVWDKTYSFRAQSAAVADGLYGFATTSGQFDLYWAVWSISANERVGRTFDYGTYPGTANIIASGKVSHLVETRIVKAEWFPVYTDENEFKTTIDITPPADRTTLSPMLTLNISQSPNPSKYQGGSPPNPYMHLDNLSLTRPTATQHPFDEPVRGKTLEWQSMRLNEGTGSEEGEHLNLDRKWGFNVTRRQGNEALENVRSPDSLGGVTVSGHLDIPRLIRYHPYAASVQGSPAHLSVSTASFIAGSYIIPSGRALIFDVKPRRTFEFSSDQEVLLFGTTPAGFFFPSGGRQYGAASHWFDPGADSVAQIIDVRHIGPTGSHSTYDVPLVADDGDVPLWFIYMDCYTSIMEPTGTSHIAYWHSADVNIYEVSTPFVASGINTVAGNRIGYDVQAGLAHFLSDTTSTHREGF